MNPVGHSSPAFCHDSIATTARRIAEAKFDVWEIVGEGLHDPIANRQEFQRVLPSYDFDVQLHAPISDVNLGSLVGGAWLYSVERIANVLVAASHFGVQRATIHPGNHTPLSREHYPKLHAQTKKALRKLDRVAADLGLELCLENMPTGWAFETDSLKKLLDLRDETDFKFCFDLGHAHVAKRLPEFVAAARHLGNVHIHDNKGDVDSHLGLDEGTVPWRKTVKDLLKNGYRGAFIVESRAHGSGRTSRKKLLSVLKAAD